MKQFLISFFVIIPVVLFSQDKNSENRLDVKKRPVISVSSKIFKVKDLSFTKLQYDVSGDILETVFRIENLINTPSEFYIFVIATYEREYIPKSSFESPALEDRVLIKNIQTYPDDLTNFEYTEEDENGVEQKVYYKYPKNIKAGIDQETGKPYVLTNKMIFRARHFSKYDKKEYYFFNTINIMIFDAEDEELVFSQNYMVRPIRRR
jgi:hypothetical protein